MNEWISRDKKVKKMKKKKTMKSYSIIQYGLNIFYKIECLGIKTLSHNNGHLQCRQDLQVAS